MIQDIIETIDLGECGLFKIKQIISLSCLCMGGGGEKLSQWFRSVASALSLNSFVGI